MFALWNLSFDLFFLYDVGGWAKVGEGGWRFCVGDMRRRRNRVGETKQKQPLASSLHLSTKRLIIKLQNVDREQMRKVKQIDES